MSANPLAIARERDYDKIFGINNSKLKHFKRSPMHYLMEFQNPTPHTYDMIFGIAYHALVLEDEKAFLKQIDVMDESKRPFPDKNYQTHANADWKRAYIAAAKEENKSVITLEDHEVMKVMKDKLFQNEFAKELLEQSQNEFEQAVTWNWKKTFCKGLKDITNPNFLADLKTVQNADPEEIKRLLFKNQWDRQGGMYLDGDLGGKFDYSKKLKDFFFICQEKEFPYAVSVVKPTQEVLIRGIEEYRELVEGFQTCMDYKEWPGYEWKAINGAYHDVSLPSYLRD